MVGAGIHITERQGKRNRQWLAENAGSRTTVPRKTPFPAQRAGSGETCVATSGSTGRIG